jgi:hypothetical protein
MQQELGENTGRDEEESTKRDDGGSDATTHAYRTRTTAISAGVATLLLSDGGGMSSVVRFGLCPISMACSSWLRMRRTMIML